MDAGRKALRPLVGLGVGVLQYAMTQVVTFLVSLPIPDIESVARGRPAVFVAILSVTFTAGVFLAGWVAMRLRWLASKPSHAVRLVATLAGACLPLVLALILRVPLEPGNPFFFVSMLAAIVGFHVPGWILR